MAVADEDDLGGEEARGARLHADVGEQRGDPFAQGNGGEHDRLLANHTATGSTRFLTCTLRRLAPVFGAAPPAESERATPFAEPSLAADPSPASAAPEGSSRGRLGGARERKPSCCSTARATAGASSVTTCSR